MQLSLVSRTVAQDLGRHVYGVAAVMLGVVGAVWGAFDTVWQPVPEGLPGYHAWAYVSAGALILGGAALQWRRTAAAGALLVAAPYTIFALLWGRRIVGYPQIFGVWSGAAEQLALVIGAALIFAGQRRGANLSRRAIRIGSAAFGLCLVAFAFSHFLNVKETASLIPAWIPGDPRAWAVATGVGHLLAGIALISNVWATLASRLLTAMFVSFGLIVWAPQIVLHPDVHIVWAGSGITLALVGAAWVVADAVAQMSKVQSDGHKSDMPQS